MRKLFQTLTLCMMMVIGGLCNQTKAGTMPEMKKSQTAASIYGTWVADAKSFIGGDIEMMNFKKVKVYFTFSENSHMTIAMEFEGNVYGELPMELGVIVSANGTYMKNGDKITIDIKKDATTTELTNFVMKWSAEQKAACKEAGMNEKVIREMMAEELKKSVDIHNFIGSTTITSLTKKNMVLADPNGTPLSFVRTKKTPKK